MFSRNLYKKGRPTSKLLIPKIFRSSDEINQKLLTDWIQRRKTGERDM